MKLEIQPLEAITIGICLSSFFVLSLYIWLPFEKYLTLL